MPEQSPADLLRNLEDDLVHHRFSSSRAQVLREVAEAYENEGNEAAAENVHIEAAAFVLRTGHKDKAFRGYFQPMATFSEGQTEPPRDFFNEERLTYLTGRARSTSNPIHVARFADVVWDSATSKNPEMARLAVRKYLDCADLYRQKTSYLDQRYFYASMSGSASSSHVR
jgi:hypothetical protein